MIIMSVVRDRHTYVKRGEQRKYVSLNPCNQQLNQADEQNHDWWSRSNPNAVENERETDQTQNNNVPCSDRYEKTNH